MHAENDADHIAILNLGSPNPRSITTRKRASRQTPAPGPKGTDAIQAINTIRIKGVYLAKWDRFGTRRQVFATFPVIPIHECSIGRRGKVPSQMLYDGNSAPSRKLLAYPCILFRIVTGVDTFVLH